MYERTRLGEEVWVLHLAFVEAAAADVVTYPPSAQTASDILEYTMHHEEELALTAILVCARPPVPPALLERARTVARHVWSDAPAQFAEAQVDAWLRWYPGCGAEPPYTT